MRPLLLVLPLLTLTACSGGSSGDDAVARKADYVRKAEAVCAKANSDQKELKTPSSVDGLSPYVDAIVRIADETTTELLALTPPEKDRADLDTHVFTPLKTQLATGKSYAEKVRKATKDHDQIALVKLVSNPPNETAADLSWMRKYGFRECVEAADTSS